jgi:hypothetical protein
MDLSASHSRNASSPIFDSAEPASNSTEARCEHLEKAARERDVTDLGTQMEVNDSHPQKAASPIRHNFESGSKVTDERLQQWSKL